MNAHVPCALAIGGLDPGAGAGLAADLRAFSAAGVFGCIAAAALTVQSTAGLRSVRAVASDHLLAQAAEVLGHQRVRAVKLGALATEANVRAVARLLARYPDIPAIVDTPMLPTQSTRPIRGRARLLATRAIGALKTELVPLATLVTVNVFEAETLLGDRVRTLGAAHDAARALVTMGARAALVKGGHMRGPNAIDVLAVGVHVLELRARRIKSARVHGSGCVLASLIAGRIARRGELPLRREALISAIRWAKRVHHAALERAADVGDGMRVLL